MRAAILAVGSELLGSDRLDTNSLGLTAVLERYGVELAGKLVIADDIHEIAQAVEVVSARVDLILVTGGLGPTADDVTREAVARATGLPLLEEGRIVDDIRRKFDRLGREMPESNRRQALVPEGAVVLDNARGTAPGLRVDHGEVVLFLFPGVPRELEVMVAHHFEPWLAVRSTKASRRRTILRVACLPESEVEDRLKPVYEAHGALGILASPGDVRIRLDATDGPTLERLERAVREALGSAVYGRDEELLEQTVGGLLREREWTLVTAESCTGGWIAQRMTAIPGSSDYFLGGIVAYDDRIKREFLGVSQEDLVAHGAVSRAVVETMAREARSRFGSDLGVAVSGIAGPGGGSEEKPVGTVDVALAGPDMAGRYRRLRLPGDREIVRLLTTQWALDMARRFLLEGS